MSEKAKLSGELLVLLERHVPVGTTVMTLADGRPNWIVSITDDGVTIETEASKEKGHGPRRVEAWMLQAAWDHLSREGPLTNKYLLSTAGLNVKRSSAVCAILAHLPGVEVASSKPIELRYQSDRGDVVDRAFRLAREAHGDQLRKGTSIPYLSHLMSTAAIVWEHGGSDEHAAAGLLHDYVEDQGGVEALERLRMEFVDHPLIVEIVDGCSDAVPGPGEEKAPWVERKVAYLRHLGGQPAHVLLVSAADKLHNAGRRWLTTVSRGRSCGRGSTAAANISSGTTRSWYGFSQRRCRDHSLMSSLARCPRSASLVLDAAPSADSEVAASAPAWNRAMDDRVSAWRRGPPQRFRGESIVSLVMLTTKPTAGSPNRSRCTAHSRTSRAPRPATTNLKLLDVRLSDAGLVSVTQSAFTFESTGRRPWKSLSVIMLTYPPAHHS